MTVTTRTSAGRVRADGVRSGAVLAVAVMQIVAGALGGSGAFGLSVGDVAMRYDTPVMPVPAAFSIWSLIYAGFLALAVRQLRGSQRSRDVHRATGWWLVASGVFNAGWILVYSSGVPALAQVVIVALIGSLAVVLARLSRHAATVADRWLLHGPVALYAGWASVATVVGAASTGAALGVPSDGVLGIVLGTVVLLATGAIAGAVTARTRAAVPYAAAVVWALGAVVVAGPALPVTLAALLALLAVAALAVWRARAGGIAGAFG